MTSALLTLLLAFPAVVPASASSAYPSTTCYGGNWGLNVQAPSDGEVVTGSYLSIQVHSTNYQLNARLAGTPDVTGVGHYHEYLDNYVPPSDWSFFTSMGMPLTPLGNQPMPAVGAGIIDLAPTTNQAHDEINMTAVSNTTMPPAGPLDGMTNIPWADELGMPGLSYGVPGLHYLTLVPACNDHSVDWAAAINIPFYYEGAYIPEPAYTGTPGSPSISIVSPASGTTLTGTYFYMNANVQNFLFCAGCYAKASPMQLESNVGHWHIFALPATGSTMPAMPGDEMMGMGFSSMMALFTIMQPHMLTMSYSYSQQVYTVGLAPGWYTFFAVLVQNYHMSLSMTVPFGMTVMGATCENPAGCIVMQPGTVSMTNYYVSPTS